MSQGESESNYQWQQFRARHTVVVVSETAAFSLVMVLSLFGNLLVCYAVYKNPRLRCPSNYYIISLALTDIVQALFSMPSSVVLLATSQWPFGTLVCYFSSITKLSMAKASVFIMALMALNRYYKIVKPARYQAIFRKKFIIITASLAWATPIFIVLLVALAFKVRATPSPGYAICSLDPPPWFFPVYFLLMYLPAFIIGFCYWKIHRTVKMHNANVSWQTSNVEDVKVSKTLFATVVAFFSLWLPPQVIFSTALLRGHSYIPRVLSLLATLFVFMSSCVNPFIYGFMNRAFKIEFKKYFRILRRKHSIAADTNMAHFTE